MYQDSKLYPCTRGLEDNWQAILAEYQAIARDPAMHDWPEGQLYDGRWDTFGLYAFGKKRHKNCALCPITTRVVEQIPGMVMAGFSRLGPGTHIKPHVGYGGWAQYVLRCHLGLIVNDGCEMRVGPETRNGRQARSPSFAMPPSTRSGIAAPPNASSSCLTSATRHSAGGSSTPSSPPICRTSSARNGTSCLSATSSAISDGACSTFGASRAPTSMKCSEADRILKLLGSLVTKTP
jgi:hypothetical protein